MVIDGCSGFNILAFSKHKRGGSRGFWLGQHPVHARPSDEDVATTIRLRRVL